MGKGQGRFYWLNNIDPKIKFAAGIEHTNFIPASEYGNKHILYIANYHKREDQMGRFDVNRLLDYYLSSLKKVYGGFDKDDIEKKFLFRDNYSTPVYDLKYSRKVPPYQGWGNNIHICSTAQIYPEDRTMNNCVKNALGYIAANY